jgi:hypothetical protein
MSLLDRQTVREFITVIAAQAKAAFAGIDRPGYLQMSRLHPASEKLAPSRYRLDDVETMIGAAIVNAESGHNVYLEARTLRTDAPRGRERGGLTETAGVFALVVDSDADKRMGWSPNGAASPSMTVETSSGNYHYWFFLREAVGYEDGRRLGELVRKAVGADHDTGTVTQPYRVAGTPNFPGKKKRERGRTATESTRIVDFDPERLWTPAALEEAFTLAEGRQNNRANGARLDARPDEASIPADTLKAIRDGVPDGQRSNVFFNVLVALERLGFTADGALALLEEHPGGVAAKYVGRLQQEVERVFDKLKQYHEEAGDHAAATPVEVPGAAGADLDEWDAGEDPGPIPPRQWVLANQFCLGFISSLVAAGGVGKSALRLLQFISLALGRPLCGQKVFKRCRVLLISLEDDYWELQRRIQAVLDFYDVPRSDLRGWLFFSTPIGSRLAELRGKKGRAVGVLDRQIRDAIARRKLLLVGLDPFVKLHSLNENDSGDMNFVCDLLARIAVEAKIAVDIPHHVHKGSIAPGDPDAGRGSSGIKDAGRLTYTLTPMSPDEANTFNVSPEERFAYVRLDSAKVNIAPRGDKAVWFRLVGQPINNGTEDYPNGDNIQVAEPWAPPETWAGLDNSTLNAVLDTIEFGMEDGDRYSASPAAKTRAAWRAVQARAPNKSEDQCREIIRQWVQNGVLVEEIYHSSPRRAPQRGLRVVAAARPGTRADA